MTLPYNPGADFTLTSGYPFRNDGTTKHGGIDFAAQPGTAIPAMAGGKVVASGWSDTLGYFVVLEHIGSNGQPFTTWYGHQNGMNMPAMHTQIPAGGKVGEVGNTGRSDGPHVHIEARPGNDLTR